MALFRRMRDIVGNIAGRILQRDDGVQEAQEAVEIRNHRLLPVQDPLRPPVFRGRRKTADIEVVLQADVRIVTYGPGPHRRSLRARRAPIRYQA